jgi:uncharacterized protein YutE (UPF0331/DUF86 family)
VNGDETIQERLLFLRNEVGFLKAERASIDSLAAYQSDQRRKRAIERSLHLCVETCLDISRRIIALERFRYPNDNQEAFAILAERGIVPAVLLPNLRKMARFRNVLVHEYVEVDDAIVYGTLTGHLADFDAYAQAIRAYLA